MGYLCFCRTGTQHNDAQTELHIHSYVPTYHEISSSSDYMCSVRTCRRCVDTVIVLYCVVPKVYPFHLGYTPDYIGTKRSRENKASHCSVLLCIEHLSKETANTCLLMNTLAECWKEALTTTISVPPPPGEKIKTSSRKWRSLQRNTIW